MSRRSGKLHQNRSFSSPLSTQAHRELELKFLLTAEKMAALDAFFQQNLIFRLPFSKKKLLSVYFDTSCKKLLKKQTAMRFRWSENDAVKLELKRFVQTKQGVSDYLEWKQCLTQPPECIYSSFRYFSIEPGPVISELASIMENEEPNELDGLIFSPFLETLVWRRSAEISLHSGTRLELAFDTGHVRVGLDEEGKNGERRVGELRQSSICELELELTHGELDDLIQFAQELQHSHGLVPSSGSKFRTGLNMLGLVEQ